MLRQILPRILFPTLVFAAVAASWWLHTLDAHLFIKTGLVVALTAFLVAGLELALPHSPRWRLRPRSAALDLTHSLVSAALVVPIVRAVLFTTMAAASIALTQAIGSTLWPTSWPLPLQLALAVIAADFGAYWAHRSMHLSRIGWRAHALHHSPEGLNVLAAGRSHPFNAFYTLGAEHAVVLLLGATPEILILLTTYKGTNGLLQHANIDLQPPRWLSHIMATSEVHRWHHSRELHESNTNFGNTTMIWDLLFGTFFLPTTQRPPEHLGIEDTHIPEHYLAHIASPFTLDRYESPLSDLKAPTP